MFSQRKADRVIKFIGLLKHTIGEFHGKPFELLDWQEDFITRLFGTVRDDNPDVRQYTTGYLEIPKKNGKSELGAALALNMLCNDDEYKAEVYSVAADRDQASIIFNVAVDMVEMCPALRRKIQIVRSTKRMIYIPTGSTYRVLSSEVKTKHGLNVSACIFDELHTQPNRDLYDVMTKGSGDARKQPLYIFLTTAGHDIHSICYEVHQKALDILEGKRKNPYFLPVVYGLPLDADWTKEENWYKANPSLGKTISIDAVRRGFAEAQESIDDEMQFRQLRLNQWIKGEAHWMRMDKWDECRIDFTPEELAGKRCYAGLDLSSTSDITAFVLVFPPQDDLTTYAVLPYFWLPEDQIDYRVKKDKVPYREWQSDGLFNLTSGNVVDYREIRKKINQLGQQFFIKEIAFDRWHSTQINVELEEDGFNMVMFGQGYRDMSPPTKELERMVLTKDIAHDGNPVLRWMMDNAVVSKDAAGNIKPDKEKSTEKIDGVVALIMGLDRASRNANDSGNSIYDRADDRPDGLLIF